VVRDPRDGFKLLPYKYLELVTGGMPSRTNLYVGRWGWDPYGRLFRFL
jgi:hypothetical protein